MPAALPDREQIRQVIFRQKLELEAEKHLRNLRREAFIEVRA
jgi:peptidyl-prolyl cis-trans isomerase SurA